MTKITTDRVNARDMSQTWKGKQDYGAKSQENEIYSFSRDLIILEDSTLNSREEDSSRILGDN